MVVSPLKKISEPTVERTPSAAVVEVIVLVPLTVMTDPTPAMSTAEPSVPLAVRVAMRFPLTLSTVPVIPAIARPLVPAPPLAVRLLVLTVAPEMLTPRPAPAPCTSTKASVKVMLDPPEALTALPAPATKLGPVTEQLSAAAFADALTPGVIEHAAMT